MSTACCLGFGGHPELPLLTLSPDPAVPPVSRRRGRPVGCRWYCRGGGAVVAALLAVPLGGASWFPTTFVHHLLQPCCSCLLLKILARCCGGWVSWFWEEGHCLQRSHGSGNTAGAGMPPKPGRLRVSLLASLPEATLVVRSPHVALVLVPWTSGWHASACLTLLQFAKLLLATPLCSPPACGDLLHEAGLTSAAPLRVAPPPPGASLR